MTGALESSTWYCHGFCKIPKIALINPTREDEINGKLERELIELSKIGKVVPDPNIVNN